MVRYLHTVALCRRNTAILFSWSSAQLRPAKIHKSLHDFKGFPAEKRQSTTGRFQSRKANVRNANTKGLWSLTSHLPLASHLPPASRHTFKSYLCPRSLSLSLPDKCLCWCKNTYYFHEALQRRPNDPNNKVLENSSSFDRASVVARNRLASFSVLLVFVLDCWSAL